MKSLYFCVSKPNVILIRPLNVNIYQGRPIVFQGRFCFLQKSIGFKRIYAGSSPLWNLDFTYVFCEGSPPMECSEKWGANRSDGGRSLDSHNPNGGKSLSDGTHAIANLRVFTKVMRGGAPHRIHDFTYVYPESISRGVRLGLDGLCFICYCSWRK